MPHFNDIDAALRQVKPAVWRLLDRVLRASVRLARETTIPDNPNAHNQFGSQVFHAVTTTLHRMGPDAWERYGAQLEPATQMGLTLYKVRAGRCVIVIHSDKNKGDARYIDEGREGNQGLLFARELNFGVFCELTHNATIHNPHPRYYVSVLDHEGAAIHEVALGELAGESAAIPASEVPTAGTLLLGGIDWVLSADAT